ncbi:MAG: DUF2127 domain-containing protein [Xanthomonadales bacterium]|nr:DUF2127 domain-containing protein [Xanthomonadales bacterium]
MPRAGRGNDGRRGRGRRPRCCVLCAAFRHRGYGLWRGRHWAEWFTLVATASLVPLEAWAFFDSPTALRAAALLLNLAIVGVLFVLLRRQRRRRAGAGGVR